MKISKTIIITGSSSGVGFALANHFHEKGYKVYGLSRSIPQSGKFTTFPTDIINKNEVKNTIEKIKKESPTIDYLINNAGRGMVGAIEDAEPDEIIHLFQLNLVALVNMISLVAPIMREQKSGKIINISSLGSIMGLPFRGFYSASKAAVDKLTEAMRYEVQDTKLQICTINLGDAKTKIADHRIKSKVSPFYKDMFEKVYKEMNDDVDKGFEAEQFAPYLEKILLKNKLKPHYYYGSSIQKLSVIANKLLPQYWFEKIIQIYSGM